VKNKFFEKINRATMVIQANANISTYTRKVNQEIQGKTVCYKETAVIRRLYVLIQAALNAEYLIMRYSLYSVQY
jgi:hypothetical protein